MKKRPTGRRRPLETTPSQPVHQHAHMRRARRASPAEPALPYVVRRSRIHGRGVYATQPIAKRYAHRRVSRRPHHARGSGPALRAEAAGRRAHVPVRRRQSHLHRCGRRRQCGALHQSFVCAELRDADRERPRLHRGHTGDRAGRGAGLRLPADVGEHGQPRGARVVRLPLRCAPSAAARCSTRCRSTRNARSSARPPRASARPRVAANARRERVARDRGDADRRRGSSRRDRSRRWTAVAPARRPQALQDANHGQADRHGSPDLGLDRQAAARPAQHRDHAATRRSYSTGRPSSTRSTQRCARPARSRRSA